MMKSLFITAITLVAAQQDCPAHRVAFVENWTHCEEPEKIKQCPTLPAGICTCCSLKPSRTSSND